MKELSILILLLAANLCCAQQSENKSRNNTGYSPSQLSHDSLKSVKVFNDSLDYQIHLVNSHLNSIEVKWNWILNNPEQQKLATAEGWFNRMTLFKEELNAKKEELESLKK
jgi:hypothetical protein